MVWVGPRLVIRRAAADAHVHERGLAIAARGAAVRRVHRPARSSGSGTATHTVSLSLEPWGGSDSWKGLFPAGPRRARHVARRNSCHLAVFRPMFSAHSGSAAGFVPAGRKRHEMALSGGPYSLRRRNAGLIMSNRCEARLSGALQAGAPDHQAGAPSIRAGWEAGAPGPGLRAGHRRACRPQPRPIRERDRQPARAGPGSRADRPAEWRCRAPRPGRRYR